uniref:Uncharacterized protein n=1 Tax=Parascaris univalens TaxID=6257 RepID=A0A915BAX4_PARUN
MSTRNMIFICSGTKLRITILGRLVLFNGVKDHKYLRLATLSSVHHRQMWFLVDAFSSPETWTVVVTMRIKTNCSYRHILQM